MQERKTILYIAMSLDGYIAGPHDDLDFLNMVARDNEDYGYHDFIRKVDTLIMGRRTYDWVMGQVLKFPHPDLKSYIITHKVFPPRDNLIFYNGDLKELIRRIKQEEGKHIFIDGGAELVNSLLDEHLVDEMIISIIPVLLGSGIRLFNDGRPRSGLNLSNCRSYESGLVQVHYRKAASSE